MFDEVKMFKILKKFRDKDCINDMLGDLASFSLQGYSNSGEKTLIYPLSQNGYTKLEHGLTLL